MSRPDWNSYFLNIAKVVSERSTCKRASVGAIIVNDRRIIATGYNGAPSGETECIEAGCIIENGHCVRTIHAEQNAILQAAKYGVRIDFTNMYVYLNRLAAKSNVYVAGNFSLSEFPCKWCGLLLRGSGIMVVNLLDDGGVMARFYKE